MQGLLDYLKAIQDIKESDKEHTCRTALQNFLESIKNKLATTNKNLEQIIIHHEPNNDKEGRGAPDFAILNNGLNVGYIENKRVNANLGEIAQSSQIQKYLKLSQNIMLTDYLCFALVGNDDSNATNSLKKPSIIKSIRICEFHELKTISKNKALLESKSKEILEFFTLFFTKDPKPINTALEFANALALRTRYIRREIFINRHDRFINGFRDTLEQYLYGDIDDFGFADSFAQTLTYSLFLAKLNNRSNEKITLYNTESFITGSFPLIQTLCTFLVNLHRIEQKNGNQSSLLRLKELINGVLHIINNIDIQELTKELNKSMQKDLFDNYLHKDPYLHFYETFLKEYDPKLREMRGIYYTPTPVVRFIINAIDLILKEEFKKQGLQSAIDSDITLLDFAAGTGTFLLEAFEKALEKSDKSALSYNPKALLNKFYGFEYLITPYVVAHLRISEAYKVSFHAEIGKDYKGEVTEETRSERLHIYLTNTLYINDEVSELNQYRDVTNPMTEKLVKEFTTAQKLKEQNILIITGNPPYSGASSNEGLYEDEVRITYGLEPSLSELTQIEKDAIKSFLSMATLKSNDKKEQEKLRSEKYKDYAKTKRTFKAILDRKKLKNEKNPKWLLDDYVKFINFAESKIKKQESGIFAFISNNSFLDNPTFRGMRYSLLKTFDMLYILDLHGNARKKETAPSGDKDDNVFDIMQGVSINIFVKLPQSLGGYTDFNKSASCHSGHSEEFIKGKSKESNKDVSAMPQHDKQQNNNTQNLATIYHYDLYGKRKDKYNFLLEHNLTSIPWQELKPKDPFYLFIPQNESLREEYDKGWSVKDMFKVSGVGICSKRDNIVFHNSKESLKQMLNDFINKPKEELHRIYNIGEDSGGWKLEWAIDEVAKNKDNLDDFIMPCHYRPFDYRWTYYTNKNCGFMARPVYDVFKHFLQDSNAALLVARQSQAIGDNEFNATFISNKIVDLNFYRRGGEEVMPLYLQNTESSPSCHSERSEESKKLKDVSALPQHDKTDCCSKAQSAEESKKTENFTKEFREFINAKYKWSKTDYKENPELFITQDNLTLNPESILGYIYAVLFHKDYREKYIDFLKVDFPKIPFVDSKKKFIALSKLGLELISVHLMQDSNSNDAWDITRERERERESRL